jgi:nickel superoxide dismutase
MTVRTLAVAGFAAWTLSAVSAGAHCEVPCGVYGDAARFDMIEEDCQTIEKAMSKITSEASQNQVVRWTNAKEDHAGKVQHIVSQYFMTQRIKVGDENYDEKLTLLHQMLVAAMKCKQTTDVANVEELRRLSAAFKVLYLGETADGK